jgi:hypothetical protein
MRVPVPLVADRQATARSLVRVSGAAEFLGLLR